MRQTGVHMRLEFAGKSDLGGKRKINQDSFCMFQKEDAGLFAVADGMGGHTNGEKASQTAIAYLSDWWTSFSPVLFGYEFRRMLADIEKVVKQANNRIYTQWNQNGVCGTTITVLFIYRNLYGVIYAGDSRCYVSLGRKWEQLTIDEVWENQSCIDENEREQKEHPNRGKLVNAIGIREAARCRALTDYILPDSAFVLCSDGLYKFCTDRFIRNCVRRCGDRQGIEQAIDKMIGKVYQNGAGDNISVVVVKCCEE